VIETRDRRRLERVLRRDPVWGGYALGDLDDRYFERTRWFLADQEGSALVMLYEDGPSLSLMTFGKAEGTVRILAQASLPEPFHIHYPEPQHEAIQEQLAVTSEPYLRYGIQRDTLADVPPVEGVEWNRLTKDDVAEAESIYRHYPENFFVPDRVDEGLYMGARIDGRLVAVGGTHVVSAMTRVAALGDIMTEPACRGRGIGARLTWHLCGELFDIVDLIVLNVAEVNIAGRRTYEKVGFGMPVRHYEGHDARSAKKDR